MIGAETIDASADFRLALIEADLVSCMVALPGQLFYSTQIPVCVWFLAKDKSERPLSTRPACYPSPSGRMDGDEGRLRGRRKQTLFIDARKLGTLATLRDTLLPTLPRGESSTNTKPKRSNA